MFCFVLALTNLRFAVESIGEIGHKVRRIDEVE